MNISVVLLQHNLSYMTRIALASIRENEVDEIILVDNGSEAGEIDWADQESGVKVVRMGANTGYMRGTNAGWKMAQNEFIVLCNNDIALSCQCLKRLRMGMETDQKIGWLTACYQDGAWQNSRTEFPEDIKVELNNSHGANRAPMNSWSASLGDAPKIEYLSLSEATVVMVRKSTSDQVGYFWEELINYHVHDYSMRLTDAGLKMAACKNAVYWHSGKSPTIHADMGASPWREMDSISIPRMNERWGDRWKSL